MSIAEEESTRKYYLLDGPEHGDGLREKLLDVALENRHVIAQRNAYVAGRTAEPTEAEIKAVVRATYDRFAADWESDEDYARHLLDAARKAVSE